MGAYEMLAGCYDRLTNDVDYEAIAAFYRTLLRREDVRPRTAVDLACGTGSVTAILAREGLRVWRGEFDASSNICSYGMDLFRREGEHWLRSFEEHREYAYSREQLEGFLRDAGFIHIRVYGDRTLAEPGDKELRMYFSARKGVRL